MTAGRVLHQAATPQAVERSRDALASCDHHLRKLFLRDVSGDFDQATRGATERGRETFQDLNHAMHDAVFGHAIDLIVSLGSAAAEPGDELTQQSALASQDIQDLMQSHWKCLRPFERYRALTAYVLYGAELTHHVSVFAKVVDNFSPQIGRSSGFHHAMADQE